jgi:hypothetical protein
MHCTRRATPTVRAATERDAKEGVRMTGTRGGRRGRVGLMLLAALAAGGSAAGLALAANPNEREVKPAPNVQDPDDIFNRKDDGSYDYDSYKADSKLWVLEFKFKDPRLIKVDVPGHGQRVCWYMWYQVINRTKEPRLFVPDFELVTHDTHANYHDQILPKVQDAIRQIEDPNNYLNIKNSVTISAEPIPPSPDKDKGLPKAVTGVAIWEGDDKLFDSDNYTIFVSGLSNGWAVTDPVPPDTNSVVRRKTLKLNFKRLGDRYEMKSSEIHFNGPPEWVYRASSLKLPDLSAADADKKDEKKDK